MHRQQKQVWKKNILIPCTIFMCLFFWWPVAYLPRLWAPTFFNISYICFEEHLSFSFFLALLMHFNIFIDVFFIILSFFVYFFLYFFFPFFLSLFLCLFSLLPSLFLSFFSFIICLFHSFFFFSSCLPYFTICLFFFSVPLLLHRNYSFLQDHFAHYTYVYGDLPCITTSSHDLLRNLIRII